MSSRVLRDDLWTSERVNALHDKTFRLYICLINAADDYGLCEISFGAIRRAAPLLAWGREEVAKMLAELTDADLIRPYESAGKPYAAIVRWRAYVNSVRPKFPVPSFGMGHCNMPTGFKDIKTRKGASLILKHLTIESGPPVDPQPHSRVPLEKKGEGGRGKGEGNKEKEQDAPDPASDLWTLGVVLLTSSGLSEKLARSFLGSMLKSWPDETVLEACRAAVGKAEPKAYIAAVLRDKPKRGEREQTETWD